MKDLTTGNERSAILRFAAPMLLGNLFQQGYNLIDAMIVGNLLGKQALAATGASFPIIFALISFVIGIASAGTIIISQYYGAKNYVQVRKAIDTILIFVFAASLIITTVGILFSKKIFEITHLPADVIPYATAYLNTFLCGTILLFGFNGMSSILRGIGDSKTPLYFLVMATILNIILDFVFIMYFNMGIKGAAMATVVSQGFTFFGAAIYLNKTHKIIKINFLRFDFDKKIFFQSIRIGIPSGFQQTFVALGMIALFSIVNLFDTDVIAAYTIAGKIDNLAMLPAMTFGQALSTFVGQNLGAGKIERVRKGLISTLVMSTTISAIITILVILLRKVILLPFIQNETIINIGAQYLIIVSSAYVIFSIMFSLNGVMRGAGDTLIPMFITLFSLWIIRIPFAGILSGRMYEILQRWNIDINFPPALTGTLGEKGVWMAVPLAWAVGAICSFLYYRTGNWKKKAIIKQNEC